MVRRTTWILVVVFVLLVGFTFFFQRYQSDKSKNAATSAPTTPPAKVYNLENTQVNDIKIANSAGDKIDLYRVSGSTDWAIADLPDGKADSFKIESISAQLFSLQAQETLSQTPPLDSIGLVTPSDTITVTTSDGTQIVTDVGSLTPIGSGYYLRVDSGQVVIVNKVTMDDILNVLKEPPLLPTATPKVTPTEATTPTGPGGQSTPTP